MKNTILFRILLSACLIFTSMPLSSAGNKNGTVSSGNKQVSTAASTGKVGSVYRLNMNNINLPIDNKGIIAAVNIPEPIPTISGEGGKFAGDVFLFSSGFFLSGYADGNLFSNAMASASLVEDYVPGTIESGTSDPRAQIYVVKSVDDPFSQSWQDWKDAVDLGADYYDGNNDGKYDPVDLNGNLKWDADEDRPDLLGDETAWCVYNDGLAKSQRRWNTVGPLGIEVRQTIFGFASMGTIGNILFVRYRIKYVGLNNPNEAGGLDSVYFGIWADPDLGDPADDLIGCDISRNAGFTYNDGPDNHSAYGSRPPAFLIDYLSGPVTYIAGETFTDINGNNVYDEGTDTPLDTAVQMMGDAKGIKKFPGAKNLGASSFIQYINGDARLDDPDNAEQANNFIRGLTGDGSKVDPCNFPYGEVNVVDCNTLNDVFWYSGDPVTGTGWLNTVAADARQMTNTGPFTVTKGEEKEIFVAYVVGQGSSAFNSIQKARDIDDLAQNLFDNNNFIEDIVNSIPLAPSLYYPPDNYYGVEKYEDLLWRTTFDTEIYRLKVFEETLSDAPIIDTLINSPLEVSMLKSGMLYKWQVRAQNSFGSSNFTDPWSFIMLMEAPELTAEAVSKGINKLTWVDKSNNTNGFLVERVSNGTDYIVLDTVDANVDVYYDSTAAPGITYYYFVSAFTKYASGKSQEAAVTTITGINDVAVLPSEFSIKQNYPNPFNPATVIEYSLPVESNVKVTIYSSLGETVAVLAGGIKPAGNYQVNFNATALSSGIYFCTIKAESTNGSKSFWDIKKMILLK